MKHAIICFMGASLLLAAVTGCRSQSDALMPYDHNDDLLFETAESSFADKFQIIWNGMNQNYALWDYEARQGLDWDAVYDSYYPRFKALDERGEDQTVTDDELMALLEEMLMPLHDGHFRLEVKNHKTGSTVICQPLSTKATFHDDFQTARDNQPRLDYYTDPAHGEVLTDADGNPLAKEGSTNTVDLLNTFCHTSGIGLEWILGRMNELKALPSPTEMQAFEFQQLKDLLEGLDSINGKSLTIGTSIYNELQSRYLFLEVPGFFYIDPAFADSDGIRIRYALFKGNIAYLGFDQFDLNHFLDDSKSRATFNMDNPYTRERVAQVKDVWQSWFNSIQDLHKSGTLGGVIIDVRNNGGGNMDDFQYVVGALAPGRYIHFGYQRYKRGTGRYDYSPLMEARMFNMEEPHEDISDVPVVILVNCLSGSMSETTSLCAKTLPKGKIIGKRTLGCLCAIINNSHFSFNYSGHFGVQGTTCVFGKVPSMASFTLDKQLIESEGITPDIEVDFDASLFRSEGRDTQLERALQFLRNGQ